MITMNPKDYENAHNYDLGELWGIFDKLPHDVSILDVGFGTGRVLKFIHENFKYKFDLYGIEKNKQLVTDKIHSNLWKKGISIWSDDFMEYGFEEENQFDYLLFISSIHQIPNTAKVIEQIAGVAQMGVVIKTVDTKRIKESTISQLFPHLKELHFPIYSKITAPLKVKGFTLTLEKSVKYNILTETEYYTNLLLNRFVSSLHQLTNKEIEMAIKKFLSNPRFYRNEVMEYLVYEK